MTPSHLIACPTCARHVRFGENVCPFCKVTLGAGAETPQPRCAPTQRLSRAALYAFGVGTLTVATACGGAIRGGTEPTDSGSDDANRVADGSPADVPVEAPLDVQSFPDVNVNVPYGLPAFDASEGADSDIDAGEGEDAGMDASDAGARPDVRIAPPYGAPPTPPGAP